MSALIIVILAICAGSFVLSFITFGLDKRNNVDIKSGVILTLILWKPILVLAIIVLVLTVLGLCANIGRLDD
jgi:hypothetical protein